jgi:hypothetical protein
MVTPSQLTRETPEYSLAEVRAAAEAKALDFVSFKVQSDIAAISYPIEEVCRCLAGLEEKDFSHAERYVNDLRWNDVYKLARKGELSGKTHDLYIKFKMKDKRLTIVLCSFHPERGTCGR